MSEPDHGPMCVCGHPDHPHAFGMTKRACGLCECEQFQLAEPRASEALRDRHIPQMPVSRVAPSGADSEQPESSLLRLKRLTTEMLAEEQDERDRGDVYALERGSAYENVLEWIDAELTDAVSATDAVARRDVSKIADGLRHYGLEPWPGGHSILTQPLPEHVVMMVTTLQTRLSAALAAAWHAQGEVRRLKTALDDLSNAPPE